MKKTGINLIPQETIEVKGLTIQGKPEIFIHINKFLAKYDYKKINKIVFLGGSRKDLRTIFQYIFSKQIGNKILLVGCETQIYREVDCSTETSEELWPQLAIDWLRTKRFLLDFYSYYHDKLKEDRWFSGTDSYEWTRLREYFSKHYLDCIDYINNSQKLYSDSKIILNGIQKFEMANIIDNVMLGHKDILERYKYKATPDVYYKLVETVINYIKKDEILLLWNISRKNERLLLHYILGLGNLFNIKSHNILSPINIQQGLTSAPNLLIMQFKNANEFNKMSKMSNEIKDFLQEFEVIELDKPKTAQGKGGDDVLADVSSGSKGREVKKQKKKHRHRISDNKFKQLCKDAKAKGYTRALGEIPFFKELSKMSKLTKYDKTGRGYTTWGSAKNRYYEVFPSKKTNH